MTLLRTTTAEGALKGMVIARAPHELDDQEAAYLQDCLVHQAGFVSRRGALTGMTSLGANLDSNRPHTVCTVFAPDGSQKIGVLYLKNGGTYVEVWIAIYNTSLTFVQKHYVTSTTQLISDSPTRGYWIHTCPTIDGALIISIRYGYSISTTRIQRIAKWFGASPTTSFTGTAPTCSITAISNTTLTMSSADITAVGFPGMIIEGVGVVDKVLSATTLQLKYPHTQPGPGATVPQTRPYYPFENLSVWRARGAISFTNALVPMSGYGTKFTEVEDRATKASGATGGRFLDANTMQRIGELAGTNGLAFGGSDTLTQPMQYTGRAASLKNYILTAGLGIEGLTFYDYHGFTGTLLPGVGPGTQGTPIRAAKGSMFTVYKGHNISFNALVGLNALDDAGDQAVSGRMYVHGPRFPEIMDHTVADGDWADVVSTKGGDQNGIAIMGGRDCCILCKTQETFALTGDDPSNFVVNKIADDGALTHESVASYKGAPIWIGQTGIWMYSSDMAEPENLIANSIGSAWSSLMASFDNTVFTLDAQNERTMYSRCFVYRDHLFVNIGSTSSDLGVYTDGTLRTQTPLYLVIYLPTRALSILTNFNFTGFFMIGQKGYVVFPQNASTTHFFMPLDNFFVQGLATVDAILTSNSYSSGVVGTSVGPWFHMESRKFDADSGLGKKAWKQLAIEFNMTNTKQMWMETVNGLNVTGARATLPFVGSGLFQAKKIKFRARDQYMSFRLYEDIANRPLTLKVGAWQWAYKYDRAGAI